MRSSLDGSQLVLASTVVPATFPKSTFVGPWVGMPLVLCGASLSLTSLVVSTDGVPALVVVLVALVAAAFLFAVGLIGHAVLRPPTLRVDADGVVATPSRWISLRAPIRVPWRDVRQVTAVPWRHDQQVVVVDVDADFWRRTGRRWHTYPRTRAEQDARGLGHAILLHVADLPQDDALQHIRAFAPAQVPVWYGEWARGDA